MIVGDSIPLMRQLARMAGIPEGRIRRMVLVLDVDKVPQLYTEGFLATEEELVPTQLLVSEEPVNVDTTTLQNDTWRTGQPNPRREAGK